MTKYTFNINITPQIQNQGQWIDSDDHKVNQVIELTDPFQVGAVQRLFNTSPTKATDEITGEQFFDKANDTLGSGEGKSADHFLDLLDRMETLELSSHCNHGCEHCYASDNPIYYNTLQQLKDHIDELPSNYYRAVSLFGGEPTLYPHLFEVMEYAMDRGYITHFNSNGVNFADVTFLDRCVDNGFAAITMSLHTHDLELFDKVVKRPGSGKAVWKALRNLHERSILTMTQTVLTRTLMPTLLPTLDMIQAVAPGTRMFISASYPHGRADDLGITPSHKEMAKYLTPALEKWGHMITTIDIPMCYLYPYQDVVLNRDEAVKKSDHAVEHHHLPECDQCDFKERCIGMLDKYGELYDYLPIPRKLDEKPHNFLAEQIAQASSRREVVNLLLPHHCSAQFAITPACDLHCSHCILEGTDIEGASFDDMAAKIDALDINKFPVVNISGKEAVLHPDLPKMIAYATEKGFLTYLPTNGYSMTEDKLKELIAAGLKFVTLTLHSSDPDIFDEVTGVEGSFEEVWNTLKLLYQHEQELDFIASIVVTKQTLPTLGETIEKIQLLAPNTMVSLARCNPTDTNTHLIPTAKEVEEFMLPVIEQEQFKHILILDEVPSILSSDTALNDILHTAYEALHVDSDKFIHKDERTEKLGQLYDNLHVVHVTNKCNHNCEHCCSPEKETDDLTKDLDQIKAAVDESDKPLVSFFLREPTMSKHLLPAMEYAQSKGKGIHLSTNGDAMGNEKYFDKLYERGLIGATISMHSVSEEIWEAVTGRPGSFNKAWNALRLCYQNDVIVATQTVLTKRILPTLMDTLDAIQEEAPGVLMFLSGTIPYGNGFNTDIVPSYEEVQRYLYPVMEKWHRYITIEHLPECYVHPYTELVLNQDIFLLEGSGFPFVKPQQCDSCRLCDKCPGVLEGHTDLYPDFKVHPIK